MSSVSNSLNLLLKAIAVGVVFFVFRFADFSNLQSCLLTVMVVVTYSLLTERIAALANRSTLSPYRVVILPKFDDLLLDFKLLKEGEELEALHSIWQKRDQKLISFTVLQLLESGDWLVFSDIEKQFHTGINFEQPIEAVTFKSFLDPTDAPEVSVTDPSQSSHHFDTLSPVFYFRQRGAKYELGLIVRERWWQRVRNQNPEHRVAKTAFDSDYTFGEARLKIATIPTAAFDMFFFSPRDYMHLENVWVRLDDCLRANDWSRREEDPNSEVEDPWIRIEHKYFRVEYREI